MKPRGTPWSALLVLVVLTSTSGCAATMTAAECRQECSAKGLVSRGIQHTPTSAHEWGKDSCICVEPEADRPAAPRSGGCSKDTDCKGERICRRGSCEDPAPASTEPVAPPAPVPQRSDG
jgi:uncharacterized protein YceK